MLPVNQPNHEKPKFIIGLCRNLQQHRVIPEALGRNEIDAMLRAIGFAFRSVEFESMHGI